MNLSLVVWAPAALVLPGDASPLVPLLALLVVCAPAASVLDGLASPVSPAPPDPDLPEEAPLELCDPAEPVKVSLAWPVFEDPDAVVVPAPALPVLLPPPACASVMDAPDVWKLRCCAHYGVKGCMSATASKQHLQICPLPVPSIGGLKALLARAVARTHVSSLRGKRSPS